MKSITETVDEVIATMREGSRQIVALRAERDAYRKALLNIAGDGGFYQNDAQRYVKTAREVLAQYPEQP